MLAILTGALRLARIEERGMGEWQVEWTSGFMTDEDIMSEVIMHVEVRETRWKLWTNMTFMNLKPLICTHLVEYVHVQNHSYRPSLHVPAPSTNEPITFVY